MWFFRARVDTITTHDGQRSVDRPEERYYIGYCDEMGKREAEKHRDEILGEVINRPQILIPSQVKFSEVVKIYRRNHMPNLRETTRAMQESALKHIERGFGELRMCDIDSLAVQRWLSSLTLAHRTKQGYLALLRLLWGKAEDWGFTQQRFPRGGFALGVKRDIKGHQMPTMEQLRRLLAALEDPYRAMAEVSLYTGLRISEVRGLKWEDFEDGRFSVQRRVSETGNVDVPKSSKPRIFDSRPIEFVLKRLKRESVWLFNHPGCSYASCLDKMQAARKTAGIKIARFGWHHLRAIFNTLARGNGADAVDRQALMGHTTERMNSVYVMQAEDDVRRRGELMLAVQAEIMGATKGVQ